MRLRTQFIITMLLFGIILIVMAVSAIITNQRTEKAGEQERIASSIAQGANELSYLANDYLIYREPQQLKRWQSRFALFSTQVADLGAERPDQQALVANIRANQTRLKEVFDSVASVPASPSLNRRQSLDPASLQVSWSRMAVQSQGLVSDASRLSQLLHLEMDRLRNRRTTLIYLMVGFFGVFLLASYMLTYRRILKSLATLQARTSVIGSGNLDFIIEEQKNDEIGDLSRAFNRMTSDLKGVTASKAELEREIAQRKQAEEDLRRQREWLRVTLSSIGDAVIATDTQGRTTFLNPVAVTLTGWKSEEALGERIQNVFRIINEKTQKPAEDLVARVLDEKRVIGLENDTALLTKDGREVPIEDSAAPIKDAAGKPAGVVLVFHDVTQKRRAQEALHQSERRYRSFVDVTSQFAWVTDASGQVVEDVPALRNFTGQTYEQAKGAGWSAALHPEDLQRTLEVWNQAVFTKTQYEIEYRMRRHDGVYRLLQARGVPILNEQGNVVEWVGTCIDITERKRAEEVLRQRTLELQQLNETLEQRVQERTTELKRANEALRYMSSRLLSAQEDERKRIALEIHDSLGASLAAVKFKIEEVLQRAKGRSVAASVTETLKAAIPLIQESADECRRIQMDLRPAMLDDLGLLPTISWFSRRFQTIYSGIRIEQEVRIEEEDVPDSLKIVIFRVLQEAMNNIGKHSRADFVHLALEEKGNHMELTVRDNGVGFDVEEAVRRSTSKRGLGLTSLRERTELSGGSFSIHSAKGRGTRIHASWPTRRSVN